MIINERKKDYNDRVVPNTRGESMSLEHCKTRRDSSGEMKKKHWPRSKSRSSA